MDIRFRPEPPDAVKGVTPVKDQGADREKWKKRRANPEEKDDSRDSSENDERTAPRKPVKDNAGGIVDVVI
ncbi:hypothetical protein [Desulfatibacillum aliphaticivorans]|uniref:Uncharacterized protein n=1 Tax=Desulfatibacillum aliphaticivorans TaxID=218208 RepID=B8FK26_DESAL|nr:hypothetical protein [Desulfatibacillum aliphaticivorans]ACL02701.1 hypothetical protein Dalk_0998 [Desulfatibacillum aliphaticivorans]